MTEHKYTPTENKKPVEIVHELKGDEYQIPTFEEFMKNYESDGSLNYTDLEHSDMGENKGYGPHTTQEERCFTRYEGMTHEHQRRFFVLLKAEWGVDGQWFFGIPTCRSPKRYIDWSGEETKSFLERITTRTYNMNGIWQYNIMRYEIALRWVSDAEELLRRFASGTLSVRGRGNVHHRGAENVMINTVRTALEVYRNGGNVNLIREY